MSVPIAPGYEGFGWFPISEGGPPSPEEFGRAGFKPEYLVSLRDGIPAEPITPAELGPIACIRR